MSLDTGLKDKLFDVRMLEWNLKHGKITQAEYDNFVSQLPDEADKADEIKVFSATGAEPDEVDAMDVESTPVSSNPFLQ